jgi:hypothetical protein
LKHRATASFWKRYEALPKEAQAAADKSFQLLKTNPQHPSLHFKRVTSDLWSARVGIHYRALALEAEDGFDWVWIGRHAEYDKIVV